MSELEESQGAEAPQEPEAAGPVERDEAPPAGAEPEVPVEASPAGPALSASASGAEAGPAGEPRTEDPAGGETVEQQGPGPAVGTAASEETGDVVENPGAVDSPEGAEAAATVESAEAPEPPAAAEEDPSVLAEAIPLVEALLFASPRPVPLEKLAEAAELDEGLVARAVAALEAACGADGRGIRLDRAGGGVRLVTRAEYDYPVRRLLGLDGKTKLSMPALETLAIIAYKQPITGPEIAELRGVNSSSSIRTLLDKKLITTAGRKEVVGTPFLYKTTKDFLVHFGLHGLSGLPKPEELEAVYGLEPPPGPDPAQTELFPEPDPPAEAAEAAAEAQAPPRDEEVS